MKILIITGVRLNLGGGMEYYIADLVNNLYKKHEFTIVESESGKEFVDLKSKLKHANIISLGNRLGLDLPSFLDFIKLRNLFLKVDVVYYLSGFWNEIYSFLLQFLTGTPVVGFSWFLTDSEYRFKKNKLKENESIRARLGTIIFGPSLIKIGRFFKKYQVVSKKDYDYLCNRWNNRSKIKEIEFGINLNEYGHCQKKPLFTILYMARLDYQKGADLLPNIYEMIRNKILEFNLIIIGSGRLEKAIRELSKQNTNIEFKGYISKNDNKNLYLEYLCSSHVLISPVRYAGTTYTAIESLASGTPVIEFDVTGTRERIIGGYNGYVVENLAEMADRILDIFVKWQDKENYAVMSENSKKSAQKYNLREMLEKVEQLLLEATNC